MKKLLIFFYLFVSVIVAQAQSPEKIVKSVKEHYAQAEAIESNISFSIEMPETEPTVMQGKLFLKGNKYRFILDDQEIISDDVNQWHWTKGDINEVQLSYIDENDTSTITPSKIFSKFLRGFGYKLVTKSKFKGKNVALIEIIPDAKIEGNDIYKIKVIIDLDRNELVEMKLFENSGTVYYFQVLEQKTKEIEDSYFRFNEAQHPEVEVIDLR